MMKNNLYELMPAQSRRNAKENRGSGCSNTLLDHVHLIYQHRTTVQHSSRLAAVKHTEIAIIQNEENEKKKKKKATTKKLYKLSSLSEGQDKINRYQCRKCQWRILFVVVGFSSSFYTLNGIDCSIHLFKSDRIYLYLMECWEHIDFVRATFIVV